MKEIEIKKRWSDKIIVSGKYVSIKDCLEKNRGAHLRDADLQGAHLRGADLRGAHLQGADLVLFYDSLYSLKLLSSDTKFTFWKYLVDGKSPYQHFKYDVGKKYEFEDCNEDEQELCGKGGNVATLMWCLRDGYNTDEFIEVEFQVKDIVAIPYFTDGKFRVKQFKVLRKINRKEAIELIQSKCNKMN